jgi:hypothetical protein
MRSITRRVTDGDRADRRQQFLRSCPLEQEPRRPGAERTEDVGVVLEGREDHHPNTGNRGEHVAGRRDPVAARHADVHQHDVRARQPRAVDGIATIHRLADDLDLRVL